MDFTKFVSLLDHEALYFARADQLGDPFEGSYTPVNQEMRPLWAEAQGLPLDVFDDLEHARRMSPLLTFISAWHLNNIESAAMWSLYLRSSEGIAIRTTFGRLCESLADDKHLIQAGLVQYIDYDTTLIPEGNVYWPFVHKRRSFEHEHEVRAVIHEHDYFHNVRARSTDPAIRAHALASKGLEDAPDLDLDEALPLPPTGLYIKTRLDVLIESVYVAPHAAAWFADLVKSVMRRYDREEPVRQSELGADPVY